MARKQELLIVAAIVGALASVGLVYWQKVQESKRADALVRGHTINRMITLRGWLSNAAWFKPEIFAEFVRTGVVIEATSLPSTVLNEFPPGRDYDLKDYSE